MFNRNFDYFHQFRNKVNQFNKKRSVVIYKI